MLNSTDASGIPRKVQFKKPTPGEFPYYEMQGDQLSHGASLGNRRLWVNTTSTGHVKNVFCNSVGVNLLGSMIITYAIPTKTLLSPFSDPQNVSPGKPAYVLLGKDGPGTVRIHPFFQQHIFDLAGELHVEESVLVPKVNGNDPSLVIQRIAIKNNSLRDMVVLVTVRVNMQGELGDDLIVNFNPDSKSLEIVNESHPDWARIIGAPSMPVSYRTTRDVSAGYTGELEPRLHGDDTTTAPGMVGELQFEISIKAGGRSDASVIAAVSGEGMESARKCYGSCADFRQYEQVMVAHLSPVGGTSMVETPDPVINQGLFWAKIDMLKVMADYPQGTAFTNDPGRSTNVVARDAAWFAYGCDYLDQHFSAQILTKFAEIQYEDGKIPEYYNAVTGCVEDYDLTMNDDTPLFVLACCHHYNLTRDTEFLNKVYSAARRAADYMISQKDEHGLVIVRGEGYGAEGIASWRNVIPNYQINGAVTEINSECYAALKALAMISSETGDRDYANLLHKEAEDLKEAINRHLINPVNGLYYLNIDTAGRAHTDVTADQVFPVLFGVADTAVANRIVSRLREDDFLTSAGLRTVPRNSPDYEPSTLSGLKGGVWPGVAFWYAFAAARTFPEYMIESLHAGYLQYMLDPLKNNTVPGEFSEWFDGESLVNRGMRLSPWEPPRLLWAAVEGLCGVKVENGKCTVSPTHPEHWKWLALRRMPFFDGYLTFFVIAGEEGIQIYSSDPIETPCELHVVGRDVSQKAVVNDYRIHRAAFRKDDVLTLCIGSEANTFTTVSITLRELLENKKRYSVRMYSHAAGWQELGEHSGSDLSDMAVNIGGGEFRVVTISPSD
ncbi:MAG: amylo-alpha-1,6-glucosidase [Armatimonadota bacterium]